MDALVEQFKVNSLVRQHEQKIAKLEEQLYFLERTRLAGTVVEETKTLYPSCGGGCGHVFDNPQELVHGMSGCSFSICGACWDKGMRFEDRMKELGWVPAQKEIAHV